MRFQVALIMTGLAWSQPRFEVAAIRACKNYVPQGRSGAGREIVSPGGIDLQCEPVRGLIQTAYVLFANGRMNPFTFVPIEGGPSWINSERYTIAAKADGSPSQAAMHGPMLQALLEDRFNAKVHRETRQIPVYFLTVDKRGLKLKPFPEGSCTPLDRVSYFATFPPPELPKLSAGARFCRDESTSNGPNRVVDAEATSIDSLVRVSLRLDRPVINQTGVTGLFNFHLEYAPDQKTLDDPLGAPSIFTVLQQLGLRLEAGKGPGEFLVIDRVERPTEN